jgi:hypothetical protein
MLVKRLEEAAPLVTCGASGSTSAVLRRHSYALHTVSQDRKPVSSRSFTKPAAILGIVGGCLGFVSAALSNWTGGSPDIIQMGISASRLSLIGVVGGVVAFFAPPFGGALMLLAAAIGIKLVDIFYAFAAPLLLTGGLLAIFAPNRTNSRTTGCNGQSGRALGIGLDVLSLVVSVIWIGIVGAWSLNASMQATQEGLDLGRQSDTGWIRLVFWTTILAPFAFWTMLLVNFQATEQLTPGMVFARRDRTTLAKGLWSRPFLSWQRAGLLGTMVAFIASGSLAAVGGLSERSAINQVMATQREVSATAASAQAVGDLLFGPISGELQGPAVKGAGLQVSDFVAEARMTNPHQTASGGPGFSYGIFFGAKGQTRSQLAVTWNPPTQYWALERVTGPTVSVGRGGEHATLNTGADESNVLRVLVKDMVAVLTVNRREVATVNLGNQASGDVGIVFVSAFGAQGRTLQYDEFRVWALKS